ncbi:phosphatidic acid phosphatase [Aeromicrobium sp. A1-2]|uniref:phosphatase PAP2 family protein n=1 Tax=Aeromicrobium sp. A1-2 TaxID=2107713 RepID=UPI000E49E010|nr:phosphatase PAP2 family protein [Aeromicrobium sp. A1-2]AXT85898.1 phosphatidic acid phosphatase [Aeromicrobium sp. A1-2]
MSTSIHPRQAALPLTLTAAAIAALLGLADSAREHDGVSARLDPQLATDAVHLRTGLLTRAAHLLTFLGSEIVVGGLALVFLVVLLQRRGRFLAGCFAMAMAVSVGLTVGVKLLVERPPPGSAYRLGSLDTTYSFPSGHSLNSAVLLGLVVLLVVPLIRSRARRILAIAGATLLGIGIGVSRVYLGYHWASDVLASWLIAAALLTLVSLAVRVRLTGSTPRSGSSQVLAGAETS